MPLLLSNIFILGYMLLFVFILFIYVSLHMYNI